MNFYGKFQLSCLLILGDVISQDMETLVLSKYLLASAAVVESICKL